MEVDAIVLSEGHGKNNSCAVARIKDYVMRYDYGDCVVYSNNDSFYNVSNYKQIIFAERYNDYGNHKYMFIVWYVDEKLFQDLKLMTVQFQGQSTYAYVLPDCIGHHAPFPFDKNAKTYICHYEEEETNTIIGCICEMMTTKKTVPPIEQFNDVMNYYINSEGDIRIPTKLASEFGSKIH